jgi:hypothetical protein
VRVPALTSCRGRGALVLWLSAALTMTTAGAAGGQTVDAASTSARIGAWLSSSGLAKSLQIEKLRWAGRPDKAEERWLQLELRFVTTTTRRDEENQRFMQMARSYTGALDRGLAETLFYRLVNEAGVPRSRAAVYIIVLDQIYLIAYDAAEARLILQQGLTRDPLRVVVDLGSAGSVADSQRGSVALARDTTDLPSRVQAFLRTYFATTPAVQVNLRPLESEFAGVDVEGLRARVLSGTRFWERLQISIELRAGPASRRAVCYIDGQYASGFGNNPPAREAFADMETRFASELERFTNQMLRELQAYLARPR